MGGWLAQAKGQSNRASTDYNFLGAGRAGGDLFGPAGSRRFSVGLAGLLRQWNVSAPAAGGEGRILGRGDGGLPDARLEIQQYHLVRVPGKLM